MDSKFFTNKDEEKARYLEHNNDVYDNGYRNFVTPIVDLILRKFSPNHKGLDFGAGTGPVISVMLKEKGYDIVQYDPFFHNHPELLKRKYDYIACCEVIEHLYNPYQEFEQLSLILNSGGELLCMTDVYNDEINFEKWYYKDDPTHVFFYHPKAFDFITAEFNFSGLKIDKRLVRFIK